MPFPIAIPIRPRTGQIRPYFLNFLISACRTNGGTGKALHMAHHTGVRYVLDTGVALHMLAQEPHLRSIITAERYVNRLNSPDAMTEAMSDGLLTAKSDRPGDLLVVEFEMLDFTRTNGTYGVHSWSVTVGGSRSDLRVSKSSTRCRCSTS